MTACNELKDFSTEEGTAYVGTVIGTTPDIPDEEGSSLYCEGDGSNRCSFIRKGFPQGTKMYLSFDATEASSSLASPGFITTDDDICGEPTFDQVPLLPIYPLEHDFLSQYTFPGKERLRNYMFLAKPSSGRLQGREVFIFLSLIHNGRIEVRVVSGQGRGCAVQNCQAFLEGNCDFFGIFPLKKTSVDE